MLKRYFQRDRRGSSAEVAVAGSAFAGCNGWLPQRLGFGMARVWRGTLRCGTGAAGDGGALKLWFGTVAEYSDIVSARAAAIANREITDVQPTGEHLWAIFSCKAAIPST